MIPPALTMFTVSSEQSTAHHPIPFCVSVFSPFLLVSLVLTQGLAIQLWLASPWQPFSNPSSLEYEPPRLAMVLVSLDSQ